MMRRTRWDDKGERDGSKDESRRWNNRCSSQMDWNMNSENENHQPQSSAMRHRATPSPIDYRSESRRQHDNQQNSSVPQNSTGPHGQQQSLMGPPQTHFQGTWPLISNHNIYPEANRSHHAPPHFPQQQSWGHAHPGYYQSGGGQYAFDLKWWAQQKQSMDAYLGGPSWADDSENTRPNADWPQWSFGTRVTKNYSKRHNSRSGSHNGQGEGSYGVPRQDAMFDPADSRRHHSSTFHHRPRSRDSSHDSRRRYRPESRDYKKIPPAHHQLHRDVRGAGDVFHGKGRENKGGKKKKQKQHQNKFEGSSFQAVGHASRGLRIAGASMMLSRGDKARVKAKTKEKKGKKKKISESATLAEAAKKKALADAANKLKQTFLAAKKKNNGAECSVAGENEDSEDATKSPEENSAQDLSMPRRNPSCLEFDIDIRFSAKEWASVGRGQGGTSNILGIPPTPVSSRKRTGTFPKSGALLGEGSLGCKPVDGDEQEDSGTYSDTDVGRAGGHWPSVDPSQPSSSVTRRRHMSESSGVIDLRKNPSSGCLTTRPGPGRVRSCSMSVVESAGSSRDGHGTTGARKNWMKIHLMPKLRKIMLKQLLTMDKKSLQELVDDPRSRKAQFMMSHLMSEHRAALSQRLSQQRFRPLDTLPDDELRLLNSLDNTQMSSLPPEVVQQVREILAMEQNGDSNIWEEVSLSINDLLNTDSDPDLDCQIISPPPRDPTSTITIHDTDSEMEEHIQGEGVHEDDEEEEEQEDDDDDEDEEEEEDEEEDDDDDDEEEEEEDEEEAQVVSPASPNAQKDRRIIQKQEVPTPPVEPKSAENPLQMMPQIPVEVPLCVMDSLGGTSGSARGIPSQVADPSRALPSQVADGSLSSNRALGSQVSEAAMGLMGPGQPPVNTQRPATGEIPVAGPAPLLLAPPPGVKVKEERPSPIGECGLCMHNPRTPHTSECVYPYGLAPPSPVALMPGPPRPLGATPPQRPVPHMPTAQQPPQPVPLSSPLYQRSIKQEKLDESYLKYEHVKRPSSEERPKNPAPPDTARGQPSPLPIPPPAQALHPPPHPRPLIFSPGDDFPDPPRPPPPPPPQFSPRIKLERHTPVQFMCCCMRNECERSSTHSAEMRPASHRGTVTPQPSERRPTPHLYKMEPPSPCASQVRTPHQSLSALFAPPASPRCLSNGGAVGARVTIGVQTEKERQVPLYDQGCSTSSSNNNNNRRQYVPNLSLARSVTPLVIHKVDKSTTTEDLLGNWDQQQLQQAQQQQRGKNRAKGWWWHRNGRPRNHLSQLTAISNSLSEFEFSHNAGVALQQMMVFSEQETEFLRHLENVDQEIHELMREKKRMTEELGRLQHLRIAKLQQLVRQSGLSNISIGGEVSGNDSLELRGPTTSDSRGMRLSPNDSSSDGGDPPDVGGSTTYSVENVSVRYGVVSKEDMCVQSTTDNASVVSSSQEKGPRLRSFSFSHTSSNDSSNDSQSVRRQRCTSTCQSPGKVGKGTETYKVTYLGSVNPTEGFYEDIANIHKMQQSISNTDSETDNDSKAIGIANHSLEVCTAFEGDGRQVKSRNRSSSLSSSAEGDVESEVPADREEEEEMDSVTIFRKRLIDDKEEAIVDSSEQQDNKMENESSIGVAEKAMEDHSDSRKTPPYQENVCLPESNPKVEEDSKANLCRISNGASRFEGKRINSEAEYAQVPKPGELCQISEKELPSTSRKSSSSSTSSSTSPSSSPDSLKCRSTSGEHCYSLRSRGPPSEVIEDTSVANSSLCSEGVDESLGKTPPRKRNEKVLEEEQADDEREGDEDDDNRSGGADGADSSSDDKKKRKRKRKTKKHRVNKRKRKRIPEKSGSKSPVTMSKRSLPTSPTSSTSQASNIDVSGTSLKGCDEGSNDSNKGVEDPGNNGSYEMMDSSGDERAYVNPPPHGSAVLDIKVIGDFVITASSDGTARCYDMASGRVMATYVDHTDLVTCVGVVGKISFNPDDADFAVITGSADKTICMFSGKTGVAEQRCEVGEGVRCLDLCWGQLFLGTEGGCGARWNFKDKKITEMVQFCGKAVTSLKAMREGGRRILLVAAKTTPLMVRDAMSGLFLRTLEHIQLTVYATLSHEGLLYAGGSNKAIVYYDFASGNSRGHIPCEADVSCLTIFKGHLIATCYDGLIRIICLKTGQLVQRLQVETTNKMFICSALYKDKLLIGNKKGEVVGCQLPQLASQVT